MKSPAPALVVGVIYLGFVLFLVWREWGLITCRKQVVCLEPYFWMEKGRFVVHFSCRHNNWTCAWLNETPEGVQNAYKIAKCWMSGPLYWECVNLSEVV